MLGLRVSFHSRTMIMCATRWRQFCRCHLSSMLSWRSSFPRVCRTGSQSPQTVRVSVYVTECAVAAKSQIPLGPTPWRSCATSLVVSKCIEDSLCKIVLYPHYTFSLFYIPRAQNTQPVQATLLFSASCCDKAWHLTSWHDTTGQLCRLLSQLDLRAKFHFLIFIQTCFMQQLKDKSNVSVTSFNCRVWFSCTQYTLSSMKSNFNVDTTHLVFTKSE